MILCFDTATPDAGLALADDKKVHAFRAIPSDRMSESIVKTASDLLSEAKIEPRTLAGIAVVVGPGSFTSLRVGLTVANQFAHQLQVPILGVRTEELAAAALEGTSGTHDFIFAQSMNPAEAYAVGFGSYEKRVLRAIHPLDELHGISGASWIGFLWADHEKTLGSWKKLESGALQNGWPRLIANWHPQKQIQYEVLEPFYGKEPNITQPKKAY